MKRAAGQRQRVEPEADEIGGLAHRELADIVAAQHRCSATGGEPQHPAGGDLATWRYDYGRLGPILSGIPRIENAQTFDWPMNGVDTWVSSLEQVNGKLQIGFSARTYNQNFAHFEWRIDGGVWN